MEATALYSKLAAVPGPIKQWLGSVEMTEENEKLEQQFHLPDGSAGTIAKLIQRLQIKDIAPQYFAGQLALELKLDKSRAQQIMGVIKNVIFEPIRGDLLSYGVDINLLDKFEMVITGAAPQSGAPKTISTEGPVMIGVPTTTPKPVTVQQASAVKPAMPPAAMPPAAAPKPLSEKGWSTAKFSDIGPAPKPAPMAQPTAPTNFQKPASTPVPAPIPAARTQQSGSSSEFLSQWKPIAPAPSTAAPVPVPKMMVDNTNTPKPIKNAPDFRVKDAGVENIISRGIPASISTKPAILEMGGSTKSFSAQSQDANKVIHYSNLKSPLPAPMSTTGAPVAESGRNVVEMTAAAPLPQPPKPIAPQFGTNQNPSFLQSAPAAMPKPAPQAPPMPPMPPKAIGQTTPMATPPKPIAGQPPAASMPPKPIPGKVIQKDFLEGK
jgi:hypothetical protein